MKIVIAGGGIGGLTAAVALLQAGYSVDLCEATTAWAEVGAGVTLSPNAMMAFRHLGLVDAIAARSLEPRRQTVRFWEDGRTLNVVERGTRIRDHYGVPYLYTHRADLHAILIGTVERLGGRIHLGARVAEVAGATLSTTDGRRFEGDLLIGADGLKSVVRQSIAPDVAHFTGHAAWRAVVPVEGPLADLAEAPGMVIGPGRMVVFYPLRERRLLNIVLFARQPGWEQEGWTIPVPASDLEAAFVGWCPLVQDLIAAAGRVPLYKWAIHARAPLECWSLGDQMTLLGDAAHAMTPFLGQGAGTAIEDGVVLARALAASSSIGEGLWRYEVARIERTRAIQLESNANADRLQGDESTMFGLAKMRNDEALGLFSYDAGAVPV